MAFPSLRKSHHDTTPIITIVGAIALVIGVLLVWQNAQSQERYSTLRSGQTTGLAQRTDQQQLTCVLWAILREDKADKLTPSMRQAADSICADVPTPTPSAR